MRWLASWFIVLMVGAGLSLSASAVFFGGTKAGLYTSLNTFIKKIFSDAEPVSVLINKDVSMAGKLFIADLLRPFVQGKHLADIDLDRIGVILNDQSWIDRFAVKKHWPDKLIIGIIPHYIVARVGTHEVLTYKGKLISLGHNRHHPLPLLSFPPEKKDQALNYYRQLVRHVGKFQWGIRSFSMSEYDIIKADIELNLPTEQRIQLYIHTRQFDLGLDRLRRFMHQPDIPLENVAAIYMNYASGFAIKRTKTHTQGI